MKIFEKSSDDGWGARLNVVDENNVVVGYDYTQDCCEDFGYYLTFIEPTRIDTNAAETAFDEHTFPGYLFDTGYCNMLGTDEKEGNAVVFKLVKTEGPSIYLVLYNYHNGYYGHGFDMVLPGKPHDPEHSGSV